MTTIAQQKRFNKSIETYLYNIGAKLFKKDVFECFEIETKAGILTIRLDDIEPRKKINAIYCQFAEPTKAAEVVSNISRLNTYSGKYNFLSSDTDILKFQFCKEIDLILNK